MKMKNRMDIEEPKQESEIKIQNQNHYTCIVCSSKTSDQSNNKIITIIIIRTPKLFKWCEEQHIYDLWSRLLWALGFESMSSQVSIAGAHGLVSGGSRGDTLALDAARATRTRAYVLPRCLHTSPCACKVAI